jgi:hypothetical protein
MATMASFCLFINMNVKEFKTKINPFDEILGLGFDLGHLKVNTCYINAYICL